MTTMADGNAVRCLKTGKIMPLHGAGEALADRDPGDIDSLAGHEMIGRDLVADIEHRVFADTELNQAAFRLYLGLGVMSAHRLGHVLGLGSSRAKLDGKVAIFLDGPNIDDLTAIDLQYRYGHMLPAFCKDAGHTQFLCDKSRTHCSVPRA